jgi:DNA-binding NarL/FixJ family response regulator
MTQRCPLCGRSDPHRVEARFDWYAAVPRVRVLSEREREVLLLLAEGMSNNQIARKISVAERTVKSHLAKIMAGLQVESRLQAGLVALAYQMDGAPVGPGDLHG